MGKAWSAFLVLAAFFVPTLAHAEPKAPTGLTATYTAPDTVTLDWDDTPGATEYWVFRVDETSPQPGWQPIGYDKYGTYDIYPYGYYSRFTPNPWAKSLPAWRYLGSATSSNYTHVYGYLYWAYRTYSEYSYRHLEGSIPYVGYQTYVPYGSYFVMAVDGSGKPGVPSSEAVAFNAAQAGTFLRAPDNVKVTPGPGNAYVVVSWDAVSGATLYRLLGKDSRDFNPLQPLHFLSLGNMNTSAMGNYWRYSSYLYSVYGDYSKFRHFYGDLTGTSYVVYSIYGAYHGYPLYDSYVPYGVYKVIAMKLSGDVMSPSSAESRVVPPGATDIAGSTGITATLGDTLTISGVSTDVNGAACTIPANAVSANTVLTISVQSSGTPYNTALPESLNKQGAILDFDIGSATLTATITVTLPVPSGQTPSSMRIYHWLNNAWTEETTGRVNGASTVSVTVSSLSPFSLGSTAASSGAAAGGGGGGGCFLSGAKR